MTPHVRTRLVRHVALVVLILFAAGRPAAQAPAAKPKLVLLVAIDQFRYDYLPRFQEEYTGGLRRLLDRGAVFVERRTSSIIRPSPPSVMSTMLSGAIPSLSGIIGNDWYDRESGTEVTSVSDNDVAGARRGTASARRRAGCW